VQPVLTEAAEGARKDQQRIMALQDVKKRGREQELFG
jgi:hypothetical protein